MQRRNFLAAVGGGGAGLLAGCVGGDGGGDEASAPTTVSIDPALAWGVAPDSDGSSYTEYTLSGFAPAGAMAANEQVRAEDAAGVSLISETFAAGVVDVRDQTYVIAVDPYRTEGMPRYWVVEGTFEADVLEDAVSEANGRSLGTHREFECYAVEAALAAVRSGTLVVIEDSAVELNGRATVERILDAGVEDSPDLTDRHEGIDLLSEHVQPAHWVTLEVEGSDRPDGSATPSATGAFATVHEDGATFERHRAFETAAFAEQRAASLAPNQLESPNPVTSADVSQDGRVVTVTLELQYPVPFHQEPAE